MSFYESQDDTFFVADPREGWTFLDYVKKIGEVIVLNASELPIRLEKVRANVKPKNPNIVASRLVHAEIVADSHTIIYLLFLESGMQIIVLGDKKGPDTVEAIEAGLKPKPVETIAPLEQVQTALPKATPKAPVTKTTAPRSATPRKRATTTRASKTNTEVKS